MAAINIQAQVDPYPPVASFQGIQSPNSPTMFDENLQPRLDFSLEESGKDHACPLSTSHGELNTSKIC